MRILIVEDKPKIRVFLKESLEAEYFAVDTAEDGRKGLYDASVNPYDLVILDYALPGMDGLAVCRELRAIGKRMPVLILSVNAATSNKAELLDAGADDYLTKPFALEELLARIRALMRRPQHLEGDVFTVGDLVLDSKKLKVVKGNEEVPLTRKEFMLLHYLMQHEGTVLSRGMILEHVWDTSVDIFSNTIESHIMSLRKKLGDNGDGRLIQTIAGRGYKIDA